MNNFITYDAINSKRKCWYIGYSKNGLKWRKERHHYACFQEKQPHKFYNFLRKYKWNSFQWKVINYYNTEAEMIQGEIDQIKIYKEKYPDWECLNVGKGGEGGDNFTDNPNKEKIRIRMSETRKGKCIGKENPMFGKCGKEHPRWGQKGYWAGKKRPNFSGQNHPMWGKHHTDKTKKQMSEVKKGRFNGEYSPVAKKVLLISPERKKFYLVSYYQFCKNNGLDFRGVCLVLQGKRKHHKRWTGKYINEKKEK